MPWNLCSLSQCVSVRLFRWQYIRLNWKVNQKIRLQGKKDKSRALVMRRLYRMIYSAIRRKNEIIAYRTIELLKLSFGEKVIFHDESGRLMHLCVFALKEKQYAVAGYLLEAYKPFMRNAQSQDIGPMLNDLTILISVAKKANQEYIISKMAKCVFAGVVRLAADPADDYSDGVDAVKLIGLNAIKNRDSALLQESVKSLLALSLAGGNQTRLHVLLVVWLHQIIKRDEPGLLQDFFRLIDGLRCNEQLAAGVTDAILAESDNFVGMIGVNQHMRCKLEVICFLLKLSHGSTDNMRCAAHSIGQMVKLAIALYGIRQGFTLLLPLLEEGRSYLHEELQFMKSSDEIRPQNLFAIIREVVVLLEIVARQDGKVTAIDLLLTIHECWLASYTKEINRRSVDQFCQLILQQIIKGRRNKKRAVGAGSPELLHRPLFDLEQIKKLGLGS